MPADSIEQISHQGVEYAVIIRADYRTEGIRFFTPAAYSQQLGYISRPKGYKIQPHIHNFVSREVLYTQEVLFIKSGKVRVDFYDNKQQYFRSCLLGSGDVILLASGGHGFEMMESTEMIEVKQGPHVGEEDKTRFPGWQEDKKR